MHEKEKMTMHETVSDTNPSKLQAVDKSDLAGLIANAERIAEQFQEQSRRLNSLVCGLAGESMDDAKAGEQPYAVSLAGLSDAQDRMDQTLASMVGLIDRLHSLIAL